ncbi:MAG: Hsp20/alpha crystallin family protein [Christensenellaceae bacterium]
MELPGIDKQNINIALEDGYLTVEAVRNHEETEKDEKSNYVFRERTYGRMSRTFYVGDGIREENIKAKYDNGILTVVVPKYREEEKPSRELPSNKPKLSSSNLLIYEKGTRLRAVPLYRLAIFIFLFPTSRSSCP